MQTSPRLLFLAGTAFIAAVHAAPALRLDGLATVDVAELKDYLLLAPLSPPEADRQCDCGKPDADPAVASVAFALDSTLRLLRREHALRVWARERGIAAPADETALRAAWQAENRTRSFAHTRGEKVIGPLEFTYPAYRAWFGARLESALLRSLAEQADEDTLRTFWQEHRTALAPPVDTTLKVTRAPNLEALAAAIPNTQLVSARSSDRDDEVQAALQHHTRLLAPGAITPAFRVGDTWFRAEVVARSTESEDLPMPVARVRRAWAKFSFASELERRADAVALETFPALEEALDALPLSVPR